MSTHHNNLVQLFSRLSPRLAATIMPIIAATACTNPHSTEQTTADAPAVQDTMYVVGVVPPYKVHGHIDMHTLLMSRDGTPVSGYNYCLEKIKQPRRTEELFIMTPERGDTVLVEIQNGETHIIDNLTQKRIFKEHMQNNR